MQPGLSAFSCFPLGRPPKAACRGAHPNLSPALQSPNRLSLVRAYSPQLSEGKHRGSRGPEPGSDLLGFLPAWLFGILTGCSFLSLTLKFCKQMFPAADGRPLTLLRTMPPEIRFGFFRPQLVLITHLHVKVLASLRGLCSRSVCSRPGCWELAMHFPLVFAGARGSVCVAQRLRFPVAVLTELPL